MPEGALDFGDESDHDEDGDGEGAGDGFGSKADDDAKDEANTSDAGKTTVNEASPVKKVAEPVPVSKAAGPYSRVPNSDW